MDFTWTVSCRAFGEAADCLVRTAAQVGDRWAHPGLGEWDVRSLVGHTTRSLLTVETYLIRPASTVEVASAAEYVRATRAVATGPEVAARGREAGLSLGADPAAGVAAIVARVVPLLQGHDGTELVTTLVGGMRLADYLPTRTFELVVHTADLAAALGRAPDLAESATTQALALVGAVAAADGSAAPLLLAATGRAGLPAGYSVL